MAMQMTTGDLILGISRFQCFSNFFHQVAKRTDVKWSSFPIVGKSEGGNKAMPGGERCLQENRRNECSY